MRNLGKIWEDGNGIHDLRGIHDSTVIFLLWLHLFFSFSVF